MESELPVALEGMLEAQIRLCRVVQHAMCAERLALCYGGWRQSRDPPPTAGLGLLAMLPET